jgi:effector-binding domain-containing protein
MSEITEKTVEGMWVISIRKKYPYSQLGRLFRALKEVADANSISIVGKPMSICYDPPDNFDPNYSDVEACFPVDYQEEKEFDHSEGRVRVYHLKGGRFVSALHKGSLSKIADTYSKAIFWMVKNHYRVKPPVREIYHGSDSSGAKTVEILLPLD